MPLASHSVSVLSQVRSICDHLLPLQSKFAMRAKTHQLQNLVIGLPINQYEVGFYMAVAGIFPFADQRMVTMSFCQWFIVC